MHGPSKVYMAVSERFGWVGGHKEFSLVIHR